jgi:hypothetical protein
VRHRRARRSVEERDMSGFCRMDKAIKKPTAPASSKIIQEVSAGFLHVMKGDIR